MPDILIVGAGLFGMTVARELAEKGLKVQILEQREVIGGNCYCYYDPETSIEVHPFGPHIFHTDNERVWEYVNKFTKFNSFRNQAYAKYKGQIYPLPINLGTINQFFQKAFSPDEAKTFIEEQIKTYQFSDPQNLEEKGISLVGPDLYHAFIEGYTKKQWETDPKKLPASIITRLPFRFTYNNYYFDDPYQGIPLNGYLKWFENLIDHQNIEVKLSKPFDPSNSEFDNLPIIYTGPIDKFFAYQEGLLTWRTLDFEWIREEIDDFQGNAVITFDDIEIPWTRITEYKHFHPETFSQTKGTIYSKEFSRFARENDHPYYPVRTKEDLEMLAKYQKLAQNEKNVIFGGRLGSYLYFDMDDTIKTALEFVEEKLPKKFPQLFGK